MLSLTRNSRLICNLNSKLKLGLVTFICATMGITSISTATSLVFENSWDSTASDSGAFSQPSQILAGEFSVTSDTTVNRASWLGTIWGIPIVLSDPLDTGDTWKFDLVFRASFRGQPGNITFSRSVVASVTDTELNLNNERAYIFNATFSDIPLSRNIPHFLSIINTEEPNTFRWNVGQNNSFSTWSTGSSGLVPNDAKFWHRLSSDRSPLNFSLFKDSTTPVPEPSTVLMMGSGLLGLIGWRWRRGQSA